MGTYGAAQLASSFRTVRTNTIQIAEDIKEHEMHHRGQLMLIERILGIVPDLTRQRQERAQQHARSAT